MTGRDPMDIKTAKAAILVESGKPLIVDEFTLPDRLEHGQVLARDIPRLVRLDEAGKVSCRGIVTDEFALEDVNDALDLMRSGKSGRILLNIS